MKKYFLIGGVIAFVFIAVVGGCFFYLQQKPFVVESALPSGAAGYFKIFHLKEDWPQIQASQFVQILKTVDIPQLLEKNNVPPQQIEAYRRLIQYLSNPKISSIIMQVLGKEAGLAFYPIQTEASNSVNPANSLIFFTRLSPQIQILEMISGALNQFNTEFKTITLDYHGQKITLIEIPNQKLRIGYVRIKDVLIGGIEDAAAKRAIDVSMKVKPALLSDKNFTDSSSSFLKKSLLEAYLDINALLNSFEAFNDILNQNKQAGRVIERLEGFSTFAGSLTLANNHTLTQKWVFMYDPKKLKPYLQQMYTCAPAENKTMKFVPKDVLAYQWNNCYNFKDLWMNVKEEIINQSSRNSSASDDDDEENKKAKAQKFFSKTQKYLNVDFENELLPALGDEIGGYLMDADTSGGIPFPKMVFFLKIKDRNVFDRLLSSMTKHPMFMLQKENYQGVELQYTMMHLGALQPGYCFLDDYFLAGTDMKTLKNALDARQNSSVSILANPNFQTVNTGLTVKNNAVFYIKMDETAERARTIIQWAVNQKLTRHAQDEAFKAGIVKRLAVSKQKLIDDDKALNDSKAKLKSVNEELSNLKMQGGDVAETLKKIDHLENDIALKEKTIGNEKDDQADFEETIKNFHEDKIDPELINFNMTYGLNPLIEILKSFDTIGSQTTFADQRIETTSYSHMR